MKKIALFINSLQKGGSERVIVNLAEYFHGKGYEVLLVTQYKREVEYDINPAIKEYILNRIRVSLVAEEFIILL